MLYYKDGTTEVQLGDKVKVRRFLILNCNGVVCYLPGLSEPHPSMVMEGMDLWAVQDSGGNLFMMPYEEDTLAPSSVSFVERGSVDGIGLAPLREAPAPKEPVVHLDAEAELQAEADAEAEAEAAEAEAAESEATALSHKVR